eukprot:35166_1
MLSSLLIIFLMVTNVKTNRTYSCEDTIFVPTEGIEVHNHTIVMNDSYQVNIHSCNSYRDIRIVIIDLDGKDLSNPYCNEGDGCGICDDCGTYTENFTIPLVAGSYYLIVYPLNAYLYWMPFYFSYEIVLDCSMANSIAKPETHNNISVSTKTWYHVGMLPSPFVCETHFGTAPATIKTDEDVFAAGRLIGWKPYADQTLLIGLWEDSLHQNRLHWMDDTNCNYSNGNRCISGNYWTDQIVVGRHQMFGTINSPEHACNITISTKPFAQIYDIDGALCNTPQSKYKLPNCIGIVNCWKMINCCNDSTIISDAVFNAFLVYDTSRFSISDFAPVVAFWDDKLFILGLNQIHYTNFKLFVDTYNWNHVTYRNSTYNRLTTKRDGYTQYESFLYLHVLNDDTGNILIWIDLKNLSSVRQIAVPNTFDEYDYNDPEYYCIAANDRYVGIGRVSGMLRYELNTGDWYEQGIFPDAYNFELACTISNDYHTIYAFAGYGDISVVLKCNLDGECGTPLHVPQLLVDTPISIITGLNDKIYIQGGYAVSWKTLVFNTKTDQFETYTVNIDNPITRNVPYYRRSSFAVFDDNILLMLHVIDDNFPYEYNGTKSNNILLYYAVTDLISIDFTETLTIINEPVWPTDGFPIKYYVDDFSNQLNDTYSIWFNSEDTLGGISAHILLDIARDNCICNKTTYNYYHCEHHFHLQRYLSVKDNDIANLTFSCSNNDSWTLILPESITIPLTRCLLTFKYIDKSTTNQDPEIEFRFNLSSDCDSRIGTSFTLNITSQIVNIFKLLNVTIIGNGTRTCQICDNDIIKEEMICSVCVGNDSFVIPHAILNANKKEIYLSIESNMIDFRVIPSSHSVEYILEETTQAIFEKNELYFLFTLLIPTAVICCFVVYCKKQYEKAHVVDNALVLIIGVSQFDDKTAFLPGVKQNVDDLEKLWRDKYGYDVFICNANTLYCSKQDIIDFIDEYKNKLEDKSYGCVIVHIISHGSEDLILSSDAKQIQIDFVCHELITVAEENNHPALVKLIFCHGCRGTVNYSVSTEDSNLLNNERTDSRATFDFYSAINAYANHEKVSMSPDSNLIIISGTIKGRAMSDSGKFTQCICKSFGKNVDRAIKADFNALITEIGNDLESKTNHAELCNINGTLRFNPIRFKRCKDLGNKKQKEIINHDENTNMNVGTKRRDYIQLQCTELHKKDIIDQETRALF